MSQTVAGSRQPPLLDQMARQVSRWWWVPLVAGLLSIVLGLAILASPWTVKALVVVTGLLFVIHGVSLVLSPAYAGSSRGEQALAGAIAVIAGIVLLAWPGPSLLLLAVFAGAWLAVSGGFNVVTSIARRHTLPYWGLTTAVGVIELLLGLWAMRRPEVTLNIVVVAIGLWAVITGVLYCVLAFEVRRIARAVPAAPSSAVAGTAAGGAAAGTAGGDVGAALERIDRLYAEGHLSEADHARLTDALRSSGAGVPSMPSGSRPASGSAPAAPSAPRSAPPRSA